MNSSNSDAFVNRIRVEVEAIDGVSGSDIVRVTWLGGDDFSVEMESSQAATKTSQAAGNGGIVLSSNGVPIPSKVVEPTVDEGSKSGKLQNSD